MKRPNPFTVLARLRAIDERRARADLATARDAHERARERLDAYKAKYLEERTIEEMLTPVELRALQLRGFRSYEVLLEAADAYERSKKQLEVKADKWRRSAEDLDAAERLEAKRKDEAARHARVAAERSLDDLLGMLHARKGGAA